MSIGTSLAYSYLKFLLLLTQLFDTSPGDREGPFFCLRVKLPPVTTSLTTQR